MKRCMTFGLAAGFAALATVSLVGCGENIDENAATPEVDRDYQKEAMAEMIRRMEESSGGRGAGTKGVDPSAYVDESAKQGAEGPK